MLSFQYAVEDSPIGFRLSDIYFAYLAGRLIYLHGRGIFSSILTEHPAPHAVEVDELDGARAVAGRDQRVLLPVTRRITNSALSILSLELGLRISL